MSSTVKVLYRDMHATDDVNSDSESRLDRPYFFYDSRIVEG